MVEVMQEKGEQAPEFLDAVGNAITRLDKEYSDV